VKCALAQFGVQRNGGKMYRRRLWLVGACVLALTLGLVATASARSDHAATAKVKVGGTLLFGAEQEPPCLNNNLGDCNNTWAAWVAEMAIPGIYKITPDFAYQLNLASKVDLQLNPMRLTYHLNPKAKWSDGKPVSAADLVYTLKTTVDTSIDKAPTGGGWVNRAGYTLINKTKVIDPKTVQFTFSKPFAAWKELFLGALGVLPAHALEGTDYTKDFINNLDNPKTGQPIGSGPFLVKSFVKGSQLTLIRNPNYWGPHKAYLNSVIFRFLTDTNTEIQQVKGGEVDAIYPQPQLPLAELRGAAGLQVQSSLGSQYEHIDIQLGPKGNPLARNPWIRRAIMMSIDRREVLKTLFSKLNPNLKPLDNVIYLNNQKSYQAHFNKWDYNPKKAQALLESHGCKKGGDGIYSCNGTRMTFSFESIKGNQLRELAFQIMQARVKASGIELTNNFKPSNIAFGQDLTAQTWDMFMFAWVGTPDPAANTAIWSCPTQGGTSNYMSYCNARATKLMKAADTELDPTKRAALENQADALIANDVPSVPLYQKPTFLVYHSYVMGMKDNATNQGPFYNAEDWWLNK
jgi:peptide/nickel transport system substrate-binding protein